MIARGLLGSLRRRLLLLAALWLSAALLAAWIGIGAVLDRFVRARFDAEMTAMMEAVIGALETDEAGALALRARPLDARFAAPLSGWYWQVEAPGDAVLTSDSLFLDRLALPSPGARPGGSVAAALPGPDGAPLRALLGAVTVPDLAGSARVAVTAPLSKIEAGIADIRAGRSERLPPASVREVSLAVSQINALLDQNQQVLARAREHIGNLAHSLRTPLAGLLNALPEGAPARPLAERMERQIHYHLRRARSGGAPRLLGQRTPVAAVLDDIHLVLSREAERRGLRLDAHGPPGLVFLGKREDLEEIVGNLAENAVRWASGRVEIAARPVEDGLLEIAVSDDGPGLPEAERSSALARGARLDEAGPGAGLGLAIVTDLGALHGGSLALGRSPLGGLEARARLPGHEAAGHEAAGAGGNRIERAR